MYIDCSINQKKKRTTAPTAMRSLDERFSKISHNLV